MAKDSEQDDFAVETVPVDGDPELESTLIAEVERGGENAGKAAYELAQRFGNSGRQREAVPYLERAISLSQHGDERGQLRLAHGQLMEQVPDFEAARTAYEQGLEETIGSEFLSYFLHNNLGYCLNALERYAEAEAHCAEAIRIDKKRHNAYKNRAIALEHLDQLGAAASHYAAAAQLVGWDPRALMHLNKLLAAHPEIYEEVDGLRSWHEELLSEAQRFERQN